MTTPEPDAPEATVTPAGRLQAGFFAAVRSRGMLNAMLEGPAKQYEAEHPGEKCRWEFAPSNGDNTLVVAREAMGFKVVDAGEISGQQSSTTSGPVRRGDLILMAAPVELHQMIADEDARAALEDVKLPETAFRENVLAQQTRRLDGQMDGTKPIGSIRRTVETIVAPQPKGGDEGGE